MQDHETHDAPHPLDTMPLWALLAITLLALITLPFDWLYYRIFGRG